MRGIIWLQDNYKFFDPTGWIETKVSKCVTQATSPDTKPISVVDFMPETRSIRPGPGNFGGRRGGTEGGGTISRSLSQRRYTCKRLCSINVN